MLNNKQINLSLAFLALLIPHELVAMPDGLAPISPEIKIPLMKNGSKLPVALYKDNREARSYFVHPLETIITDVHVFAESDCTRVQRVTDRMAVLIKQREELHKKLKGIPVQTPAEPIEEPIELIEEIQDIERQVSKKENELAEIHREMKTTRAEIEDLSEEDDVSEKKVKLQNLKESRRDKVREIESLEERKTILKSMLAYDRQMKKEILEERRAFREMIDLLKDRIATIDENLGEFAQTVSQSSRDLISFEAQNMPIELIDALEQANPGISFRFVEASSGRWQASAQESSPFRKYLPAQLILDQHIDSRLNGSTRVTLLMTPIAFCEFKKFGLEKQANLEFNYVYSFPVSYKLEIQAQVNRKFLVADFKRQLSSSFLRPAYKINLNAEQHVKIESLVAPDLELSPEIESVLRSRVADQLAYQMIRDQLIQPSPGVDSNYLSSDEPQGDPSDLKNRLQLWKNSEVNRNEVLLNYSFRTQPVDERQRVKIELQELVVTHIVKSKVESLKTENTLPD